MSLTTRGNGHEPHYDLPQPRPDLGPDDVVRIVLEALQHNDSPGPDCGLRTAFNFASLNNRLVTGPLHRFAEMVRNPRYAALIDFQTFSLEPIGISGDRARQVVHVTGATGKTVSFVFELSRQPGPLFDGCWMTDSVLSAS